MEIAIFCSANDNIDEEYFRATREFGEWCAKEGYRLVFGGTDQGLMQCVARASFECGGEVVGVLPRIVEEGGRASEYMQVEILSDNLSDRKDIMNNRCDVAVALPGGLGTIDEIFTLAASATIGYHRKRVILYNIGGFWDRLIELLEDLQRRGVIRGKYTDYILIANDLKELSTAISQCVV